MGMDRTTSVFGPDLLHWVVAAAFLLVAAAVWLMVVGARGAPSERSAGSAAAASAGRLLLSWLVSTCVLITVPVVVMAVLVLSVPPGGDLGDVVEVCSLTAAYGLLLSNVVTVPVHFAIAGRLASGRRQLIALDQSAKRAWEEVGIALKHRQAAVSNVVRLVREAGMVEASVLQRLSDANTSAVPSAGPIESTQAAMTVALMLTAMQQGQGHSLQSIGGYAEASRAVLDAEERVAKAQRAYNVAVEQFNNLLMAAGWLATPAYRALGFTEKPFFSIDLPDDYYASLQTTNEAAPLAAMPAAVAIEAVALVPPALASPLGAPALTASDPTTVEERLRKLRELVSEGLISQEEADQRRAGILNDL